MIDKFDWIKKNKHFCYTCEKWLSSDHFRYIILNYGRNRRSISYEKMLKHVGHLSPCASCNECTEKGDTIFARDKVMREKERLEKCERMKRTQEYLKAKSDY